MSGPNKLQEIITTKENRVQNLKISVETLQIEYGVLVEKNKDILDKKILPGDINKSHIERLKEYNELRDLGMRLAQIVSADKECTVKEVLEELGYSSNDE